MFQGNFVSLFWALFIASSVKAETTTFTEFICSASQISTSTVHCSALFIFEKEMRYHPICVNTLRNNTLTLQIPIQEHYVSQSDGNFSIAFTCSSLYPMGMNLGFHDFELKVHSKEIRQKRVINRHKHDNISSDTHYFEVNVPSDPFFLDKASLIRYEIFNLDRPTDKFTLFFEYYHAFGTDGQSVNWTSLSSPTPYECRLYHIITLPTEVTQQVVSIPCISFFDWSEHLRGARVRRGDITLRTKGYSREDEVEYDKTMGFLLNISSPRFSPTAPYVCDHSQCPRPNPIVLFKDFEFSPQHEHIYLTSGQRFNILKGKLHEYDSATVICSSFKGDVTLEAGAKTGFYSRLLNDKNKTWVNINSTSYVDSSIRRHFVSATASYMNKTERRKFRGFMHTQIDGTADYLPFTCLNSTKGNVGSTHVHYDERLPLYYLPKHKTFVCDSKINFAFYGGSIDGYTSRFRMWECKNVIQCQFVVSNCIRNFRANEPILGGCAKHIQHTSLGSCSERKLSRTSKFCDFAAPSEKGIVECGAYSSNSVSEFNVAHMYFIGFDSKMYFEIEMMDKPPLEAILRITSQTNEEYFYTKGRFSFKCDGHSFFYNNKLQWFIETANGTTARHLETSLEQADNTESYNPESTIFVEFQEKASVKIICSAPHATTMEWTNASISILIDESIPAKISSTESEIYFTEDGLDQAVTCYSTGIPLPKIKWTRDDKQIEAPLRVIDGVTLFFPIYNSSFAGDYTCHAFNVAGVDKQTFSVKTKKENAVTYYITAAVALSLFFIFATLALFWFQHTQKEKKKMEKEMNELIALLDGIKGKEDFEDGDPAKREFDTNYEIEKNTFYIDRFKLLGRGAFGQVYKGFLDGVDGAVAFKTIAPNAPLVHLKALISELKILMYIGHHDNLVVMLGAYRKEIKQGILHVAMELCDWGCLESFLKANKHLFLKYFNLSTNSNNSETTPRNTVSGNIVSSTLYSIKNLFKWCSQIANGMDYLGMKKVVHTDLAARNVLLTAEGNAKVTDFGLSRRTFNYSEYVKKGNDPLPWRYLAPESISSKLYSCQSDVWSYGITLWEIFSLGDTPYPGMSFSLDFCKQLEDGMRNLQPKYATEEIYNLMYRCWHMEPNKRPTFSALSLIFKTSFDNDEENIGIKVTEEMDLKQAAITLASAHYITAQEQQMTTAVIQCHPMTHN